MLRLFKRLQNPAHVPRPDTARGITVTINIDLSSLTMMSTSVNSAVSVATGDLGGTRKTWEQMIGATNVSGRAPPLLREGPATAATVTKTRNISTGLTARTVTEPAVLAPAAIENASIEVSGRGPLSMRRPIRTST